jgi:transposase
MTKSNRIRIDRGKIREAAKYDGKWVLETNDDTISLEDAASGYKGLMVIERCFRSLKRTQIKLTPMYHWLTRRIESHVRICVLALLIERIAELSCRNELTTSAVNIFKSLDINAPTQILRVDKHA